MGLFSRAIALDPEEHSTEGIEPRQPAEESRQSGLLKRAREAQGTTDTPESLKKKARLNRSTLIRRSLRRA